MKKFDINRKTLIGRLEKVEFPDWGLTNLDAKIDTGAYTSSLHCHYIEPDPDGKNVKFSLLDPTHPEYEKKVFIRPILDKRDIKSSNGESELRSVVASNIVISGMQFPIELSLTDRSQMKYPVLLGRKFIRGRFLIDVSKKYISKLNK